MVKGVGRWEDGFSWASPGALGEGDAFLRGAALPALFLLAPSMTHHPKTGWQGIGIKMGKAVCGRGAGREAPFLESPKCRSFCPDHRAEPAFDEVTSGRGPHPHVPLAVTRSSHRPRRALELTQRALTSAPPQRMGAALVPRTWRLFTH